VKKTEQVMSQIAASFAEKTREIETCGNGTATWATRLGAERCQTEPAAADTVVTEPAAIGTPATEPSAFNAASAWITTEQPPGESASAWLPSRSTTRRLRSYIMTTRHQFVAVLSTVLITYTAGFKLLSLLVDFVP